MTGADDSGAASPRAALIRGPERMPVSDGAELAPLEDRHAEEFAANLARAREYIRPWVGPSFVTDTVEGARATIARYARSEAADGGRLFGIWVDGRLVGGVMFVSFDAATGTCEVGCWLEPDAEGRGLVTSACRRLLHYALIERGLTRAEWKCRADNARSSAVARRLGMSLDRTLPEEWTYEGVRYDQQVWVARRGDWAGSSAR